MLLRTGHPDIRSHNNMILRFGSGAVGGHVGCLELSRPIPAL